MKKLIGIFVFLVVLFVLILLGLYDPESDNNREYIARNTFNLGQRIGLSGILCIGAGLLIITGGIDLSIGSVVCLCAVTLCWLVLDQHVPLPLAIPIVIAVGALIGFANGVAVSYLRVQPFVVTLCGLFLYRGFARSLRGDDTPQIENEVAHLSEFFRGGFLYLPMYLWLLLALFTAATFFLHCTVAGRYFFAIGSNERAARFSGINVDFYKILAYVICSAFAGMFSVMHVIEHNSVQPSTTGNFMELYAIAGAVLGGCSLRGGEGTTVGMLIGTAILILLPNLIIMWGIGSEAELAVIGGALLACAVLDEFLRRRKA